MPKVDIGHLLGELCTRLGYCLPPDEQGRLIADPPRDVDRFTDAVLRAEGRDPSLVDKHERSSVRALVARHFADAAP
jgi:hypothetical protein